MTAGTPGNLREDAYSAKMKFVEREIDFAVATTTKGSALANGDVFQIIDLPAEHLLMYAGLEVTEAMTGTSTDLTVDLGITGGNVDSFVDGFDLDGASVGDYASAVAYYTAQTGPYLVTTADTLDLLVASQTGTFTGGKVRVWAVLMDVSGRNAPGVATAGS